MFQQKEKPWQKNQDIASKMIYLFSGFLIAAAIGYVVIVNSSATLGMEIRELENTKEELEEVSRRLELSMLKMQSLDYITEKSSALRLVRPAVVSYLNAAASSTPLSVRVSNPHP